MTLRRTTQPGRMPLHIEPSRPDELPRGTPAPERQAGPEVRRDALGRPADAQSAREMGARGGRQAKGKTRLSARLGLGKAFADPRFEPYAKAARAFRKVHVTRLAQTVGGGECGPGPSSMVASAALQLAASRFAFEVLGDYQLGSRLADASRQNLLAAHELCAREASVKPQRNALPWERSGGGDR